MHDNDLSSIARAGSQPRRTFQASALFSREPWGPEQKIERRHGYALGELQFSDNGELKLRFWPRAAVEKAYGGRDIDRDNHFVLCKTNGCTTAEVVSRLSINLASAPISVAQVVKVADYSLHHPPFNVPFQPKGEHLVGRDKALLEVQRVLASGQRTTIGQAAVFQGLGGLGKTLLAVEYAHRHRGDYPDGVIWLTADQDIDAQLSELAVSARWIAPESEQSVKLDVARHRLLNPNFAKALLVLDNLEDIATIQAYLPPVGSALHILATSRSEQPYFSSVPLDLLSVEQALQMLANESGCPPQTDTELQAALAIVEQLGQLPLALELAGAYLRRRPIGWQGYLALLQHNLQKAMPAGLASHTGHSADLYSTLQISAVVFDEEPRLRDILNVLGWSAAAPMGLQLLSTLLECEASELLPALGLGLALRILQKTEDGRYGIHRLVREVHRATGSIDDQADWVKEICTRCASWFEAIRDEFTRLGDYETEIDHLREWQLHAKALSPALACRLSWLQYCPAMHWGRHSEALAGLSSELDFYESSELEEPELKAHLLHDLACALGAAGRLQEALVMSSQAWEIRSKLFPTAHSDLASSLSALAFCHDALGNTKQALMLAEQALVMQRSLFGETHSDIANSLNNIAGYHDALGNAKQALALAEQALIMQRALFGEIHPDIATSLNNIASYHDALGNANQALAPAEQALDMLRSQFGETHPDIATSLNNIAGYHGELGNAKQALALAEQALDMRRTLFGETHPDIANSLNNIASYHDALGNTKQALVLAEQVLIMRRTLCGETHPDIATSLNNIARYHDALGNANQALALAAQALIMQRSLFGEAHPNIATSLNNIASYHNALGNTKQALVLAEQALAMRRKLFGESHPDIATSLRSLATYYKQTNLGLALELEEQALVLRRQLLGEEHPATAYSLYGTAVCLKAQGKVGEAHQRASKAYQTLRKLYGEVHPRTLECQRFLAKLPGFRSPSARPGGDRKKKRR